MKAQKYQIKIADSTMDSIHGFFYFIDEVFIHETGVFVNHSGVYQSHDRIGDWATIKNSQEIEIEDETAAELLKIVEAKIKTKNRENKVIIQMGLEKENG